MRHGWIVGIGLCAAWAALPACAPETDGDGDADTDVDTDGDGDTDGGGEECLPDAECCHDGDCSNGVYCDGLEVCDRGRCETGPPIDCDDALDCTNDVCDEMANVCVHLPVHDACDDGDLCDGEERCDPADEDADARGCAPGSPMVCDDMDPCTDDSCEDDECRVALKDSDDDGHGDDGCEICEDPEDPSTCERGDDCNDENPLTYPGAEEICDDGDDNNCDRVRDYADPACDVPNDSCAEALTLTDGVLVHSSLRGTVADIASSCDAAGDRDVAFTFTIASVQDVDIYVESRGGRDLTVGLTAECGTPAMDIRCTTGRDFTQIHRGLPAGTYAVVVSATGETDFDVRMSHRDPAPRPDGDQCATAPDVSAGGTFTGTTVDFDPDYDATCGEVTDRDAAFAVTVTETTSMNLSVAAGSERVAVAVQSSCGVPGTELACFEGSPASDWVRHLPPGTHYVIVKTADEADFTMDIEFLPTSADDCADALDASTPGTYRGSTLYMHPTIDTSCGEPGDPDSVYRFTLTEPRDVTVDFRGMGAVDQTMSLTAACGDPAMELRCSSGTDFQIRGRGLTAGTYYLVTTGEGAGADYEFDLDVTAPVPRPPEDLCTGAIAIGSGGSFTGDTVDCENDYDARCGSPDDLDVAYSFTLTEPRSMDIEVTGGAGPVAVAVQGACGVIGTEEACLVASPTASRHVRSLEAGTWYLVFKTPAPDSFGFTVSFGAPEVGIDYVGYATWSQNVSTHGDAAQDALMDAACAAAFPGTVAATVEEIASGEIAGLPATNGSGYWLVPRCPFCAGAGGWSGAVDGHCRNCVSPGNPFPTVLPPDASWHDYCCSSTRSTVCVR